MRILVMGEESQAVCKAFRKLGHQAYSCDLKLCSGGRPEWHLQGDMFEVFEKHGPWDMVIAHPVCTYMCNSGSLRLYKNGKKENGIDEDRWKKMEASTEQFKRIYNLPVDKLAIENPIMHKHAKERIGIDWDQTIQPFEYGHPESKRTCLWLRGLPNLTPTNILKRPEKGYWDNQTASGQNRLGKGMGAIRAKTYEGWAQAMAEQWGGKVEKPNQQLKIDFEEYAS